MFSFTKHLVSIVFLLFIWQGSFAQKEKVMPVSQIPAELKEGVNAVVQKSKIHVVVHNPNRSVTEELQVITILNDKGANLAQQGNSFDKSFHFRPVVSGEIYDARGKMIKRFKSKDISEQSMISSGSIYEDNKWLSIDMRHNSYPYTLVYRSRQENRNAGIIPSFWRLFPDKKVSIMNTSLTVETLPEVGLKYFANRIPKDPSITSVDGKDVYTWTFSHVKPISYEPYTPQSPYAFIRMVPENFKGGDIEGSNASWKDLGMYYYTLNKDRDILPDEMKAKVKELTAGISDPREKIAVLYKYMQDNTRYVSVQLGIGGWQTFDADYVYENGYGDCKALSNYMKSMLREIEIPSYACAIYSGNVPPLFNYDFVSPQFNHQILCVPMEQDTVWLECTSSTNPPGYLGDFTEDRIALLYTPDGGVLARTPSSTPEENKISRTTDVQIDQEGNAVADMEAMYKGYSQEDLRNYIINMSKEDQKKWFRQEIHLGSYDIANLTIADQGAKPRPMMSLQSQIEAKNWASKSGSRLFLPLMPLNKALSVPKADKDRKEKIRLTEVYSSEDVLNFHLPEDYYIEGVPEFPVIVEEDFGYYEVNLEIVDPHNFRYTRKLELRKMILEPERYDDYRNFYKKINKLDRLQVVFANKS